MQMLPIIMMITLMKTTRSRMIMTKMTIMMRRIGRLRFYEHDDGDDSQKIV